MFVKANVFFDDRTEQNTTLMKRGVSQIPEEFLKLYRRNVVKITPMKSGYLRRSIITRVQGNHGDVGWRAPYALYQERGGHKVDKPIRGLNRRDGGFGTIKPGYYNYYRYTTPGTGKGFARRAYNATIAQMPAKLRELGLTK